jgi:CHAD domain-containing protein
MTARLPSDLLDRSAEESSRLLALSYLDQIDRARRRLDDALETEALHDFRVGLRRLRSCVRAYRMQLKGSVTAKMRRSLRKLTLATNAGRDTEVQLAWLRKQPEHLAPEDTQGLFWLVGRLEGHKYETLDPVTAEVGHRFTKAAAKCRRRLATLRIALASGPGKRPPTFGQVTGRLIQRHVARLRADLKPLRDAANVEEAHRARIAVKRLRYLLEPVARCNSRARGLVLRLKEAQDLLGELHDTQVLSEEIASSLAALSGSNPDGFAERERGLQTLSRLAGEQAEAAYDKFASLWAGEPATRFFARADEVGKLLRQGHPTTRSDIATLTLNGSRTVALPEGTSEQDEERVVSDLSTR